jgi:alpha/beta superfamily hydrolase
MESNLFRQIDEIEKNKSGVGEGDDIESILKYLEDKNKKKDNSKLPLISTK